MTLRERQPSDFTSQNSEVFNLNLSTGQWTHIANIPVERSFPAVVSMDDRMIVIAGMIKEFSNTVWIGVFA